MPTKIIRSRRKTISIIIKNNGDLIVRLPMNCPLKNADDFIKQKALWIIKKRLEVTNNQVKPITLLNNEKIPILGNDYEISITDTRSVKVIENKILIPRENSKEKLINYIKKSLKNYISEKAEIFSSAYNFKFNNISISKAKTCWGSCSFNNNLHFTYKLALCPLEIIDYVIVHELVHTKIKNHSIAFWAKIEQINSNYKIHEKWLRKNRAIIEML